MSVPNVRKKRLLTADSEWTTLARSVIGSFVEEHHGFFDMDERLDVVFGQKKGGMDCYCETMETGFLICLSEPSPNGAIRRFWNAGADKRSLVLSIFLHEVGHMAFALRDGLRQSKQNRDFLRVIRLQAGRLFLDDVKTTRMTVEKWENANKLFEEGFCDAFAMLSGRTAGVGSGTERLFWHTRNTEKKDSVYATTGFFPKKVETPHPFKLSVCGDMAEIHALSGIKAFFEREGLLRRDGVEIREAEVATSETSASLLDKLSSRRTAKVDKEHVKSKARI